MSARIWGYRRFYKGVIRRLRRKFNIGRRIPPKPSTHRKWRKR